MIDNFSSIATTKDTCDGDDDATFPKSAEAAAASGRELIDAAPGRDPDHLWKRCRGLGFSTICGTGVVVIVASIASPPQAVTPAFIGRWGARKRF